MKEHDASNRHQKHLGKYHFEVRLDVTAYLVITFKFNPTARIECTF